jgi:phage terminase large subunit-like protein
MVETVIRIADPRVPYRAVHASRGKIVRAEPIAALYEKGKASHAVPFPSSRTSWRTWRAPDMLAKGHPTEPTLLSGR